jgi:hypothetical protein
MTERRCRFAPEKKNNFDKKPLSQLLFNWYHLETICLQNTGIFFTKSSQIISIKKCQAPFSRANRALSTGF